jgi:hypothetical protein
MDLQDLTDRAEMALRAHLFNADGSIRAESCPSCELPVPEVGIRYHALTCEALRSGLEDGTGTAEMPERSP